MNKKILLSSKCSVIAVAVASGLALSSLEAQAAGLGRITVFSALGQPLRAEVQVSATKDELPGMVARLASPDSFRQAGVDYASSLGQLRFAVEKRSGGAVIKVTSERPVNDPFLDFLLELNWPAGRLVREYTFLLDPPEVMAQANRRQAVVEARTIPALAAAGSPQGEAVPAKPAPVAATEAEAPKSPAPKKTPEPVKETAAPQGGAAAEATHTVKPGETLRRIASEQLVEGVSLEQMLVALYRNNAGAFSGNNMNRLRAGAVLRIPDASEAAAIPESEARKVFRTQAADWNSYRSKLADATQSMPASDEAATRSSSGKVSAQVDEKAAPVEASKDQVKVSRTTQAAAGKAGAEEDVIAREKALKESQERVAMLEKNVAELQQLLELKNKNLAELQKQSAKPEMAKPVPAPVPVTPAPVPAVDAKPAAQAAPAPAVEAPKLEGAKKEEPAKLEEPAKPAETAAPEAPKDEGAKDVTAKEEAPKEEASKDEAPKSPAPKPAPKKMPAPPPPPVEEPSFLEELMLPLLGGGGLIAALVGFMVYRRRKSGGSAASDLSTMSSEPSSTMGPNSVFQTAGGQSVDTTHTTPPATDFSQAGPGAIDTDEVDPVAEADVYMAYGRDAQAEEILLDALQKDPQRTAIHSKLLEIYANRKSVKQFETLATELYAQTGGNGPEWDKVSAMGRNLDPANPLYGGSGVAAVAAAAVAAEVPELPAAGFDADATLVVSSPSALAAKDSPAAPAEPAAEGGMDFDFVTQTQAMKAMDDPLSSLPQEVVEPEAAPENLDFDLGDGVEKSAPDAAAEVDAGVLDFDLETAGESAKEEMVTTMVNPDAAMETLDFDLELDTGEAPVVAASDEVLAPPPVAEVSAPEVAEEVTLDFDIGAPESEVAALAPEEDEEAQFAKTQVMGTDELLSLEPDEDMEFDVQLTDSTILGNPGGSGFDFSGINLDLGTGDGAEASAQEPAAAADPHREEVATKLDLAKAYEEMGDLEGARELLGEVASEGAPDQVEQARAALDRLNP